MLYLTKPSPAFLSVFPCTAHSDPLLEHNWTRYLTHQLINKPLLILKWVYWSRKCTENYSFTGTVDALPYLFPTCTKTLSEAVLYYAYEHSLISYIFLFLFFKCIQTSQIFTELILLTPILFTPLTPFCTIGEELNLYPLLVLTLIRSDCWHASSSFSFKSLKHGLGVTAQHWCGKRAGEKPIVWCTNTLACHILAALRFICRFIIGARTWPAYGCNAAWSALVCTFIYCPPIFCCFLVLF